jgi:RNA polymerase sigma-70 factor (ECF subfamily)
VSTRLSPRLREIAEPEDVTQDVLIAIHRGLGDFRDQGDRAFYAWIFRVAENRIRDLSDYAGAKKRQPGRPIAVSQTTPGTVAIRSENFDRVHRALELLSEDHQRVIQLRRLEEREVSEVAKLMDRSENAVRILYCRALKELQRHLRERE